MPSATIQEAPQRRQKNDPTGFLAKVKSLQAEARQVRKMSPQNLLVTLEHGPEAALPAAALKQVIDLEQSIQQIRRQLESAIFGIDAQGAAPQDGLSSMIAKGELIEPATLVARLRWTRQALSKALAANRVFFIDHGKARYYPAFYADPQYERRHLEAVTKILGDLPPGSKLQFFLNPRGSLNKATPLQALASGQVAAVKKAAEGFAQG